MISLLIISINKEKREQHACTFAEEKNISPFDIATLQPETSLGIADVRELQKKAMLRPFKGNEKALIINDAHTATPEAQNALLKLLEEPPSNTYIILTAPTERGFLPTVLSRCKIIYLDQTEQKMDYTSEKELLNKILESTIGEKLVYAQNIAKEKEAAITTIEHLVYAAREIMLEHMDDLAYAKIASELADAYTLASNTNVNLRFLLENTFLSL